MTPQNTPKLPFSEVPRLTKGPNKGKINQKALQVSGEVTQCDPHPVYEGLFYWSARPNGVQWWATEDRWKKQGMLTPTEIHEKRRAAREHNLKKPDSEPRVHEDGKKVGFIDQQAMQVSWQPTQGDVHPKYPNWRYYSKRQNGVQMWMTLEDYNKVLEQTKEFQKSPKGRDSMRKAHKKRIENGKSSGVRFSMYERAHAEYEEGLITLEDRDKVYKLTDMQAELNVGLEHKDKWNLDHIIPRTHGGLTTVQNLQIVSAKWNFSKGNRNRHVMAHNGSDCDIWYRTPYVYPKTREWTHSLPKSGIKELTYQKPPEDCATS